MADINDLRIDHHSIKSRRAGPGTGAIALIVLTALALGAVGGWFARSPKSIGEARSAQPPTGRELPIDAPPNQSSQPRSSSSFTAAGYIEVIPPGSRVITSLISGVISAIHIREGEAVRSGQVVATLDQSLIEQDLARSEREVAILQARLDRLLAGSLPEEIAKAEARAKAAAQFVEIARLKLKNDRELSRDGVVSQRALMQSELELVQAQLRLAEAQADLELARMGTRAEDIEIARAELAKAQAELDRFDWQLKQCEVKAPMDGIVFEQLAQPGQWLTVESAVATIFDPKALQAWVDVNQRDLPRIAIGHRVTLLADAAPGNPFEGNVVQIMPRASIERNTVRIKIAIEGGPDALRPDMSLKVTFHD